MTEEWDIATNREWYLYNPGEAFTYDFSNETFKFPAHDGHWIDPVSRQAWPEPGVMPVRPRGVEHEWNRNELDENNNPAYKPRKHTAEEVITYFVGDDFKSGKLGKVRGIRRLSPSDKKNAEYDTKIKTEAREVYLRTKYEQANRNIARFKADNAKAMADGGHALPANEITLKDFQFVAEYNAILGANLPKHQCPECFVRFIDLKGSGSLEEHINALHPSSANDLLKAAGVVEQKKRGRPKKVAA